VNELWSRIRATWENLSPRERLLLSIVTGLFGLLLTALAVVSPILSAADSARARVEQAEQQVELMVRLRREYDEIHGRLAVVENQIGSSRDDRKIRTLLDSLASRSAVKIDSMEERETPESDLYRETKMEVALRNVTLTQTVSYLHNIESADRVLSVKSLRIKSSRGRSSNAELLDVTFTVSAFDPL
jgi:type II secretory pathway component PulM